jgi:hypothetical protein
MVGHKLGEFAPTRYFRGHAGKAERSSSLKEKGGKIVEVKATAKYLRISPRKARLVIDLIRGKKPASREVRLETHLVIRDTVKRIG